MKPVLFALCGLLLTTRPASADLVTFRSQNAPTDVHVTADWRFAGDTSFRVHSAYEDARAARAFAKSKAVLPGGWIDRLTAGDHDSAATGAIDPSADRQAGYGPFPRGVWRKTAADTPIARIPEPSTLLFMTMAGLLLVSTKRLL